MTTTVLWQDGFDAYSSSSDLTYNYLSTSGVIAASVGRFGGNAYQSQSVFGAVNNIVRQLGASYSDIWVSCAIYIQGSDNNDMRVITLGAGSGNNAGVENKLDYTRSTGQLGVYKGSGGTLAVETVALSTGWHWFDLHLVYSATVGVVEVWIDDAQVINATGLNTVDNTGYSGYTQVGLWGGQVYTYDDWFIYTGTRLGDSRIENISPSSDVSPNQGTPSSGSSHYAMVDGATFQTTNYITMPNTSGDKEVFGGGSITGTPLNVWAVKVSVLSQKSDAGSFQLEPLVVSSATEGDGSAQQLTTSWGVQSSIFGVDPHTSAQWTYAAVNAMDIGFKVA